VTSLRNPATRHELKTNAESVEFWKAAGYEEVKEPAKKAAPAKKSSTTKK
jgi:hypothetical protein